MQIGDISFINYQRPEIGDVTVERGGVLAESTPFVRRVMGSTTALAAA